MRKILFALFVLFFCCANASAQDSTYFNDETEEEAVDGNTLSSEIKGDTLPVYRTLPDFADTVKNWKSRKDFAYMKNLDSLLRTVQLNTSRAATQPPQQKNAAKKRTEGADEDDVVLQRRSSSSGVFSSGIFQIIMWALAGMLVLFILYNLFFSKGIFRKSTSIKTVEETPEEAPEDIAEGDYDKLLRQAYLLGDFRMAARWLFLKTLQKLHEKELILFSPDKTNTDYMYELPLPKRDNFSSLALYYEYIWYGNMPVSKEDFNKVESRFNQFLNVL